MNEVLDSSYGRMLTNEYDTFVYTGGTVAPAFTATEETFIRNTKLDTKRQYARLRYLTQMLDRSTYLDKSNFLILAPVMNDKVPSTGNKLLYGGSEMVASGDFIESQNGLVGNGSVNWDTRVNPSTEITDPNNWAFGFTVTVDADTGTDFGSSDGTNAVTLSVRNGGSTSVQIGTATDSFATSDGRGNWSVNILSGTFRTYRNNIEVGTATAVAGSMPNYDMFLAAYSASGTATDFTSNSYGLTWIYNGQFSDNARLEWADIWFNFNRFYIRNYE